MVRRLTTQIAFVVCLFTCVWPCAADDSDCLGQQLDRAAAGKWQGSFWVEYEPSIAEMTIPMRVRQRWQATLEFEINRDKGPNVVMGKANAEEKVKINGAMEDMKLDATAHNVGAVQFEIEGQEGSPDWRLKRLELTRAPTNIGFVGRQTVTGKDSISTGTMEWQSDGSYTKSHEHVQSGDQSIDGTYVKSGKTKPGHVHVQSQGKTLDANGPSFADAYDHLYGDPTKKATWFVLNVVSQSCATMMGEIDKDRLEATLKASGVEGHIIGSNWAATLDERDLELERQVSQLMQEPVPAKPTAADAQRVADQVLALRGEPSRASDYRLCVIRPLKERYLQIHIALMRMEIERADQTPIRTAAEVTSLIQPLLVSSRDLQLLGADCQLSDDLNKELEKRVREAIKNIVANNPTDTDLLQIARLWQLGWLQMGDAEPAFRSAWAKGPGRTGLEPH